MRVRKNWYNHAPGFLGFATVVIWGLTVAVDGSYLHGSAKIAWAPMQIISLVGAIYCGFLIRKLHQGTNTDPATGLFNRKYFYSKLSEEIERVRRTNLPLSLVLIDIDYFKRINDTFGHLEGDRVILAISAILKKRSRLIDSVVRWGGEEFAIILPATDSDGAAIFAERLRYAVESMSQAAGWPSGKITISAGVATIHKAMKSDKLVVMADNSLYEAKQTRNTVVISRSA